MAKPKIGINGFGRMGFCALRLCIERKIPVVHINASRTPAELAYLVQFDTTHGIFNGTVSYNEDSIIVNGQSITVTGERDPRMIPWEKFGAEFIIDCTGKFLTAELAKGHLLAGAKKVILSSPSKDDTPMFVYGVNESKYSPKMNIVSAASCTTNCLAPLAKVINYAFGIRSAIMTTIHAQTSKQEVIDGFYKKDLRIGRSGCNIIPTSTGAAEAVGKILPDLEGKITGKSIRVPVQNVSLIDLSANLLLPTSYEMICSVIKDVASSSQDHFLDSEHFVSKIIDFWDAPVVSSDFNGNTCPCNFDSTAGIMLNSRFVKLFAWYDNEYSYMSNLLNLVSYMHYVD